VERFWRASAKFVMIKILSQPVRKLFNHTCTKAKIRSAHGPQWAIVNSFPRVLLQKHYKRVSYTVDQNGTIIVKLLFKMPELKAM